MRPEISVGLTEGLLRGDDHRVLQAAVDHIASLGGGIVYLGPGEWTLRNSIVLRSGVSLVGSGELTILRKAPGGTSLLAEDGDFGDVRILPEDASGFEVGDGVTVRTDRFSGFFSAVATVVQKDEDGALTLDDRLNADLMVADGAFVSNACPLIRAVDEENVTIQDLVLDGNRAQCPPEDGCRGGGINFLRVANARLTGVVVRNVNGDGFSYQNSPDVVVENCVFEGNAGGGCHPGSGSARPIVRHSVMQRNDGCGLFLCWRVKHGTFVHNTITDNAQMGISIGHKDTDNVFSSNTIARNALSGVYFRDEPVYAAGHRCTVVQNTLDGNGSGGEHHGGPSAAIRIDGVTNDTVLSENTIAGSALALYLGPRVGAVRIEGEITGTIQDLREQQ